ncbi:MAG: RNA polymerase sigma factor [Rikenellaceae bacterium]
MTTENEEKIFELIANGNGIEEGFSLLMQLYKRPLYWHIRRLVVCHEDVEDVMQEAFINIFRHIDKFKRESSLKTWIYRIATNQALTHCAKRELSTESYNEKSRLVELFRAEAEVDHQTTEALLQAAILSLPEKQRVTFNLRYYDEMSYDEIAAVTQSSVTTLKTNYHYAQSRIKEYITKKMEA